MAMMKKRRIRPTKIISKALSWTFRGSVTKNNPKPHPEAVYSSCSSEDEDNRSEINETRNAECSNHSEQENKPTYSISLQAPKKSTVKTNSVSTRGHEPVKGGSILRKKFDASALSHSPNRTKSARFAMESVEIIEVAKIDYTKENYSTFFYDDDEIAEFRYGAWEEELAETMRSSSLSFESVEENLKVKNDLQDPPIIHAALSPCGVIDELDQQYDELDSQKSPLIELRQPDSVNAFMKRKLKLPTIEPSELSKEDSHIQSHNSFDSVTMAALNEKYNNPNNEDSFDHAADVQTRIQDIEGRIRSIKQQEEQAMIEQQQNKETAPQWRKASSRISTTVETLGEKNVAMDDSTSTDACNSFDWDTSSDEEESDCEGDVRSNDNRSRAEVLRSRIQGIERRIDEVQRQSLKEREGRQHQAYLAKVEYRQKRRSQHKQKLRLSEEIQSVKDENAQLRQKIEDYRQDYIAPRLETCNQLQTTLVKAEDSCADLIEHIVQLKDNQSKLEDKCNEAKAQLSTIRQDYYRGCIHHKSESKLCRAYEECFTKILFRMQQEEKRRQLTSSKSIIDDSRSNDAVIATIEQGRAEIHKIRSNEVSKVGQACVPSAYSCCYSSSDTEDDDGSSACSDDSSVSTSSSENNYTYFDYIRYYDWEAADNESSSACSSDNDEDVVEQLKRLVE